MGSNFSKIQFEEDGYCFKMSNFSLEGIMRCKEEKYLSRISHYTGEMFQYLVNKAIKVNSINDFELIDRTMCFERQKWAESALNLKNAPF